MILQTPLMRRVSNDCCGSLCWYRWPRRVIVRPNPVRPASAQTIPQSGQKSLRRRQVGRPPGARASPLNTYKAKFIFLSKDSVIF